VKIRIKNPTRDGAGFTSSARVRKYVAQGCAKLSVDGKQLIFVEDHYRKQNAELSAREMLDQEFRLSATRIRRPQRRFTLEEIRNLPSLPPVVLATNPKRVRRQSTRNGKVTVIVRDGVRIVRTPLVSIDIARRTPKMKEQAERDKEPN
jgi:hypothetical protein